VQEGVTRKTKAKVSTDLTFKPKAKGLKAVHASKTKSIKL